LPFTLYVATFTLFGDSLFHSFTRCIYIVRCRSPLRFVLYVYYLVVLRLLPVCSIVATPLRCWCVLYARVYADGRSRYTTVAFWFLRCWTVKLLTCTHCAYCIPARPPLPTVAFALNPRCWSDFERTPFERLRLRYYFDLRTLPTLPARPLYNSGSRFQRYPLPNQDIIDCLTSPISHSVP